MKNVPFLATVALALLATSGLSRDPGFAAGRTSANLQVAQHFRAGQQDLRTGRFADAAREFRAALQLDPGLSEAEINLGLTYHLLCDYKLATEELEKGLARNPNVLGANIVLGIDDLKLGLPDRAVEPLKRALGLDPSNQTALRALAAAYVRQENFLDAAHAYRAAFRQGRKGADGWLRLGKGYLRMSGQLTALLAHNYSNTVWAHRLAGNLLRARHLSNDAAREYLLGLSRDPSQPGLHASLADVYLRQGKLQAAEQEYRKGMSLDPSSPRLLLGLVAVKLEDRRVKEALRYVSRVARASPQFLLHHPDLPLPVVPPALAATLASQLTSFQTQPGALYLLASLDRIAGESAQAHEEWVAFAAEIAGRHKRTVDAHESISHPCQKHHDESCVRQLAGKANLDFSQHIMLGSARFALKEYTQAGDAFAAALAQQKENPEAIYWLVLTYSKLADDCFARLEAHFPDSPETLELLAESYSAQGNEAQALHEYQRAAAAQPENALFFEAMGRLYLKEHRLPDAGRALRKALSIDPTRAQALYLMARFELGQHEPEKAVDYALRALHYEPALVRAQATLGMAYLRSGKPALAVPQLEKSANLDYYGDLHYMLFQAYRDLGESALARRALATSQAMRQKTETRDQTLIRSAEENNPGNASER